ncbi:membrane protein [Bacillus coahuilensis m2-6]|uniref:Membrane protein n=1 Tax=Bacillus coahuilensis p1.1.43 TaxID=1150625 RepID=A0A147KA51_9BACI|nr:membrane protein [Bacillus coahuilensis p1.1.43]KUP08994.1 membrane protein [Bacillus coahuilensis m2-6]
MRLFILIVIIFITFSINLIGLLQLWPLYLTSPLLFISLFFLLIHLNGRNRFKGF